MPKIRNIEKFVDEEENVPQNRLFGLQQEEEDSDDPEAPVSLGLAKDSEENKPTGLLRLYGSDLRIPFGESFDETADKEIDVSKLTGKQKRMLKARSSERKSAGLRLPSTIGHGAGAEISAMMKEAGNLIKQEGNIYSANLQQRHKYRADNRESDLRPDSPFIQRSGPGHYSATRNPAEQGAGDGGAAPTGPGVGISGVTGILGALAKAALHQNPLLFMIDAIKGSQKTGLQKVSWQDDNRDMIQVIRDQSQQDTIDSALKGWKTQEDAFNQSQRVSSESEDHGWSEEGFDIDSYGDTSGVGGGGSGGNVGGGPAPGGPGGDGPGGGDH